MAIRHCQFFFFSPLVIFSYKPNTEKYFRKNNLVENILCQNKHNINPKASHGPPHELPVDEGFQKTVVGVGGRHAYMIKS